MSAIRWFIDKNWLYQKYIVEKLDGRKISKLVGCKMSTIYRNLMKYKIKIRSKSEALRGLNKSKKHKKKLSEIKLKFKKLGDRNWLYNKYWVEGLDNNKIAEIVGCKNQDTVYRALVRNKIKRRNMSEVTKGKNNPFYNKHHSKASKDKISKSRKGKCKGEKNHAWLGGISFEPYGLEFNKELKEQIRKRDQYRCQQCFRHQDELYSKSGRKYKLHIHHIDYVKTHNNPENLISLCKSCHSQTNYKRSDWINYFKNKI